MKHHYIKRNGFLLEDEKLIIQAINDGSINEFYKFPIIKSGDYLTCCSEEESCIPNAIGRRGSGFMTDLTFKVTNKETWSGGVIYFGGSGGNGVYPENVRLATEEEIEKVKKK